MTQIPQPAPELSIVVLSWNTRDVTRACLGSLQTHAPRCPHEVIVVDNASTDGSAAMVADEFPAVRLQQNASNLLYAEGNNVGARLARGRLLCLLNSDTEVHAGSMDALVRFLDEHPDYGAVSPRLVNPDQTVQRSCNRLPCFLTPLVDSTVVGRFPPGSWLAKHTGMRSFDHLRSRDVPQPSGACFMMHTREFLDMGGFDPQLSLFYNDVDLCKRLWDRGRRIRFLAEAVVTHHMGASTRALSRKLNLWMRNRSSYFRKHFGRCGALFNGLVVRLWALQVRTGIRLGRKSAPEKAHALAELRSFLHDYAAP